MATYAKSTTVSSEKSRGEIEATLQRYGATSFMYGWDQSAAIVAFDYQGKRIRFMLPLPDRSDREFTHHSRGKRTQSAALAAWEQATRQRWRALLLVIKAKLEAVEAGISTFEQEFLAHIVLPTGETVGQWMIPQVERAYLTGNMPKLLPLLDD